MSALIHRVLQVGGMTLAAIGVAFVAVALARHWPSVSVAVRSASAVWLFAGLALGMGGMLGIALVWTGELRRRAGPVPVAEGASWYFVGELAKYVPGGIWSVVGRGEMAVRGGIGRAQAYSATVFALGGTFGAAGVVALLMVPAQRGLILGDRVSERVLLVGGLALLLVAAAVLWLVRERLARRVRGSSAFGNVAPSLDVGPPPVRALVGLILRSLPVWGCMGASTWALAVAFGVEVPVTEALFATSLAWFAGFVVFPAPSGFGVRELVFVWALASAPPGTAALIAATARVVSILADVVGAGAGSVFLTFRRSRA
jgi:glycosyltransferase 2 family protein